MSKFAGASTQAASVIKCLQGKGNILQSVGTARNYEASLKIAAKWAKENGIQGGLRGMGVKAAMRFLKERSEVVGQKTLDQNRQALQCMMQHVTHKLNEGERLEIVKGISQELTSRVYTPEQVKAIADHQLPKHALATEIAYAAGLRASELLTLRPIEERVPDIRLRDGRDRTLETKFHGRSENFTAFTVHGKGGLIREVRLPPELSQRLETFRLEKPEIIRDRGINREVHYAIGGGHAWSIAFSRTSEKLFGWSHGAHGLRHSYAQERMQELRRLGTPESVAKETVSQEVGHFRPDITDTYLR